MKASYTQRELLNELGIGDFNATMVLGWMNIDPATTDPKSPGVIMLVQHLQEALYQLGANVTITGYLDQPTASYLEQIVPGFLQKRWADVVKAVIAMRDRGVRFPTVTQAGRVATSRGIGFFDLPDVPGGTVTYIAGAALLWHLWKKRRKR